MFTIDAAAFVVVVCLVFSVSVSCFLSSSLKDVITKSINAATITAQITKGNLFNCLLSGPVGA